MSAQGFGTSQPDDSRGLPALPSSSSTSCPLICISHLVLKVVLSPPTSTSPPSLFLPAIRRLKIEAGDFCHRSNAAVLRVVGGGGCWRLQLPPPPMGHRRSREHLLDLCLHRSGGTYGTYETFPFFLTPLSSSPFLNGTLPPSPLYSPPPSVSFYLFLTLVAQKAYTVFFFPFLRRNAFSDYSAAKRPQSR